MSRWTHSSCDGCWTKRHPGRVPARHFPRGYTTPSGKLEMVDCCFCGNLHRSGIYVRHDPNDPELKCGGKHEED